MPTPSQIQGTLENWLPVFFEAYQSCRIQKKEASSVPFIPRIDCEILSGWFKIMEQPLLDARRGAFHCDPWEVAGLGRNEVRNSAVLTWLLNPKGSHGLGDAALKPLLEKVHLYFHGEFPNTTGKFCNVRAEMNPDGEVFNRVDIEIDSENFYLVVEVKIDALEGEKQLERYGSLAELQAGNRPWAMVFLTPRGRKSETSAQYSSKVMPISWAGLSQLISRSLQSSNRISSTAKGVQQQMAEQIVRKFLKKIRGF